MPGRHHRILTLVAGLILLAMSGCDSDDEDNTPPRPNPMTWELPPTAIDSNSIEMEATPAYDDHYSVEYFFQMTTGEDGNSGWESASNWQPVPYNVVWGLAPDTVYTFRVRARDSSTARNLTGWSTPASVTTPTNPWRYGPAEGYDHPAPSGSNRVLLVFCHGVNKTNPETAHPVDFTAVTYGGQPLTQIVEHHQSQEDQFAATSEIWVLAEADIQIAEALADATVASAAASDPITVEDPTENMGIRLSSAFYQNVDQADPFGDIFTDGLNDNGLQTLAAQIAASGLAEGSVAIANCTIRASSSGASEVSWTWQNGFSEIGAYTFINPWDLAYSVADLSAGAEAESGAVEVENNGVAALAACVLNHAPGTQISTIE